MWIEQRRGQVVQIAKKSKGYPSDLTHDEGAVEAPLMSKLGRRCRPISTASKMA